MLRTAKTYDDEKKACVEYSDNPDVSGDASNRTYNNKKTNNVRDALRFLKGLEFELHVICPFKRNALKCFLLYRVSYPNLR